MKRVRIYRGRRFALAVTEMDRVGESMRDGARDPVDGFNTLLLRGSLRTTRDDGSQITMVAPMARRYAGQDFGGRVRSLNTSTDTRFVCGMVPIEEADAHYPPEIAEQITQAEPGLVQDIRHGVRPRMAGEIQFLNTRPLRDLLAGRRNG